MSSILDPRERVTGSLDAEADDEQGSSTADARSIGRASSARCARFCWPSAKTPTARGCARRPARVARMYAELFGGLHEDPRRHLRKFFTETCDEVVLVRDISFNSMCEHHMLPFMGTAHVAYLPGERVIGLSKLARVVEEVARRPQVQERMTEQIANLLVEELARQGRGGGDRGGAHVHDDPRRPQARLGLRHLGHEGLLPHQVFDPRGTDDADLRRSSLAARSTPPDGDAPRGGHEPPLDQQRERIQDDLRGLIAGEVRCDDVFLQLFASDASIYEIKPLGGRPPALDGRRGGLRAVRRREAHSRSTPAAPAPAWRANRSGRGWCSISPPTCAA